MIVTITITPKSEQFLVGTPPGDWQIGLTDESQSFSLVYQGPNSFGNVTVPDDRTFIASAQRLDIYGTPLGPTVKIQFTAIPGQIFTEKGNPLTVSTPWR